MSLFKHFLSILGKTEAAAPVAAEVASAPVPVERRTRRRVNTNKGTRALIIDDSPTVVAVLKKILRSAGYVTLEALDAEKGLELARIETPDLIFLDIVLPGMNGFAALRLIRRDPLTERIPVIMISGNEQATEQFYAKRIGADDFMKKPFSRFEVFARIECLLDANLVPRRRSSAPGEEAARPPSSLAAAAPVPGATPASSVYAELESRPPVQTAQVPQRAGPASSAVGSSTPLEARKELTAMGLQYYDQEQFFAAIRRGDKLAVDLFVLGGGVKLNVGAGGLARQEESPTRGRSDLVA